MANKTYCLPFWSHNYNMEFYYEYSIMELECIRAAIFHKNLIWIISGGVSRVWKTNKLNDIISVVASHASPWHVCIYCCVLNVRRRAGISWPTGRIALWVRVFFCCCSYSFISFDIDIMTSIRSIFQSERNPPTSTAQRTFYHGREYSTGLESETMRPTMTMMVYHL